MGLARRTEPLAVHRFENRAGTQCHPFAQLTLLVNIHPGLASRGRLIPPASERLLLAEEPGDRAGETRVFGKAELAQNGEILEEIGAIV